MIKLGEVHAFAKAAHAGQLYDGKDYFETHVLDVVNRVMADPRATERHVMAALLHDTIEDNPSITVEAVQELLGPEYHDVANAVFRLTKATNEDYNDYMEQLVESSIATIVKYHDSSANFAYGGRQKYAKNIAFLERFLPPVE